MIAVDTNILIYAHRQDLPLHEESLKWLRHLSEGSQLWGIPVFCLGEFVRVTTHPRIFDPPSTLDEATGSLTGLLRSPVLRILSPGSRYFEIFSGLLTTGDARGNLAFDAQIAAVCREHGVRRLLTADRDFMRFSFLALLSVSEKPFD